MPPTDRGLLARLDALVTLVADRHGLALLPDGRLAAAEARVAARVAGLAGPAPAARPGGRGRAVDERDAVELRAVAEGVGLLRVRGEGQVVGLVAGDSSARNVRLWPRGGQPAIDHLEGAF